MNILVFISLILFPISSFSSSSFELWKKQYIKRASKRGLPSSFLRKHLAKVRFDKSLTLKEKKQITSNKKINYKKWIKTWLRKNPSRIEIGRKMLQKHNALLKQVEKKYNIDKEIIVSLWGVETFYGKITGDHDLITALATLAYKSRRRNFFEIQLNSAFRLLYKGHVTRDHLKGSWAGATGQLQFMPSNFNGFARDFDGDGKKDIWTNHGDIFASIAYYLKKRGWKKNKKIGILVRKTREIDIDSNKKYSLKTLSKLGIKTLKGEKLSGNKSYKIVTLPFSNSPLLLVKENYKPIMGWNNSSLFAAFNIILTQGLRTY